MDSTGPGFGHDVFIERDVVFRRFSFAIAVRGSMETLQIIAPEKRTRAKLGSFKTFINVES